MRSTTRRHTGRWLSDPAPAHRTPRTRFARRSWRRHHGPGPPRPSRHRDRTTHDHAQTTLRTRNRTVCSSSPRTRSTALRQCAPSGRDGTTQGGPGRGSPPGVPGWGSHRRNHGRGEPRSREPRPGRGRAPRRARPEPHRRKVVGPSTQTGQRAQLRFPRSARSAHGVLRPDPELVRRGLHRRDPRPAGRVGGDSHRRQRAGRRTHGFGENAGHLPVVAGHAGPLGAAGRAHPALPGALRQPAQGAGHRRRTEPAGAARGDTLRRATARSTPAGRDRGSAVGRHHRRRTARFRRPAPRRPDHHPGVALPHPHQRRAGVAARRPDGDRRRGPRGGGHQAWRPPRAEPGASGRPVGHPGPADRPVRHGAAGRGGRPLPGRNGPGGGGPPARGQDPPDRRRGAGRGHDPARRTAPRRVPGRLGGLRPAPSVDLAGGRAACPRPRAGPFRQHRLRQLAPARGAALRPAERAVRRTARRGHRRGRIRGRGRAGGSQPDVTRGVDGRLGSGRRHGVAGDRAGPPQQREPGATGRNRGGSQGWPAARGRRDLQPGTRHRHGSRRPGRADRVPAKRRRRDAAHRPRGPPGRRHQSRRHHPEASQRPARMRHGRRADALGGDRAAAVPAQPPRRAGPADRGNDGDGGLARRRARRAGPTHRDVRDAAGLRLRGGPGHARRPLPLRRVRRAAPPHHLGPRHRDPHRPPGRPAARRDQRRHHSRPGHVRRLPRRGAIQPGRGTRRGDGL